MGSEPKHAQRVPRDDEVLTQYVFDGDAPQRVPRPRDTDGISLLRGQLSVREAARFVRKVRFPYTGDSVRHALCAELRSGGFVVSHTPNRRNPLHVSAQLDAEWNDEVRQRFDDCFGEIADTWEGGEPS